MANLNRPPPVPPASLSLSTTALPARDRLPIWREVFGQTIIRLDIEPVKGTSFYAEGKLHTLPGAAFATVAATPVRVSRTPKLIGGDMADMVFVLAADVPLRIAQHGQEQVLEAGDAIFLRGGEPSIIESRDRAKFINISVPADDLTPMLASSQKLWMTMVSRQCDALDLLLGYVHMLQARPGALSGEPGQLAAGHIRDLMAAMIEAEADSGSPVHERVGVRAARLRSIKADIGRYLCEPALSINMIAMRQGVSPRYVRKLFQEEQTTFSDYVLFLRLERSRQLLRSPVRATSTIASIAHACGFNDLSYFNRTFRRRYSITPSDFRNGVPYPGPEEPLQFPINDMDIRVK